MLSLTLTPPWGTAIMRFGKFIENRMWAPPAALLGQRFAIHQGKTLDEDALDDLIDMCPGFPEEEAIQPEIGGFLGTVELHGFVWFRGGQPQWSGASPLAPGALDKIVHSKWRNPTASHLWCLRLPLLLATMVPCRGLQKLWHVPEQHLAALEACR